MRPLLVVLCFSCACSGSKPPPPNPDAGPPGVDCPPALEVTGECRRDADCASGACVADPDAPRVDGARLSLRCAEVSATGDGACRGGSDCARG
ncbi:MAG: hypothetical protein GXP55_05050, partial [Deltaproteobacteria bacterium]|nr:hypothetical protein [Deltaproteobacteria bacterium]